MRKITHFFAVLALFVFVALALLRLNNSYHHNIEVIQEDISILVAQIRSRDRQLTPDQYADYLEAVNNHDISIYYSNVLNLICLFLFLISVLSFYVGRLIGNKSNRDLSN